MHKKIKELELGIVEGACAALKECGFSGMDAEELGEITDMLKDLSEARYYDAIADAMHVEDDPEAADRMGYDRWRYASSGRFAPTGRGERMGYPVDGRMMPEGREDWATGAMGYEQDTARGQQSRSDGRNGSNGYNGARMGYSAAREPYMAAREDYERSRRAYTANKTADNRKAMEQSADRHLDEIIETTKEMWAEVDQPMRQKMRDKLVDFVNEDLR